MNRKRAYIVLPDDLLADVDALIGPSGRSAFITQIIRDEVNRRRLLQFLINPEPIFKDEDYPEFRDGSYEWVRRSREEDLRLQLGNWLDRGAAES